MKLSKPVNQQQCQNCDAVAITKIEITHGAVMLCAECVRELRRLLAWKSEEVTK